MTWLRSIFGIGAGALNLLANGADWKHVLVSLAIAGLGIVSHVTSTSGQPINVQSGRGGVTGITK